LAPFSVQYKSRSQNKFTWSKISRLNEPTLTVTTSGEFLA